MDRKQFLSGLLVLPAGVFLVNCSSSDDSSPNNGSNGAGANTPAAAPTHSNATTVYTSSNDAQHSHTFSLDDSAVSAPPTAGVSGDSSNVESHTHAVAISTAQLMQVATGQSVPITSGASAGHTHVFTFVKIA